MKKIIALCIGSAACWLAPMLALAQSHEPEAAASATQQLVEEIGFDRLTTAIGGLNPAGARNLSMLQQKGRNNIADIEQVNSGTAVNEALIVQAGNANILGFKQTGSGNAAVLTLRGDGNTGTVNQQGSNNSLDGRITGNKNTFEVHQNGIGNRSTFDMVGDGRDYPVLQIGNNNSLVQREGANSTAPRGYGVEMRGNGIRLTIEQGHAQP